MVSEDNLLGQFASEDAAVLILVLVEDGLGGNYHFFYKVIVNHVLILVLVEDGLGEEFKECLNLRNQVS